MLAGFAVLAGGLGRRLPTGFVADEDQGYLLLNVQLPDAASFQRTTEVTRRIEGILERTEGVQFITTNNGFSQLSRHQRLLHRVLLRGPRSVGRAAAPGLSAPEIMATLNRTLRSEVPDAVAVAYGPPAIPGIGTAGVSPCGSRTEAAGPSSS